MPHYADYVDWLDIETRCRARESARSIARDYPISHVAITKRDTKKRWRIEGPVKVRFAFQRDPETDGINP